MSRNKNISKKYPIGTRVQTRDNYLDKTNYFDKKHSNPKDLYRGTYVVDSNSNDELALVKLTTNQGKSSKGNTSEYIKLFDCNGNPIKIDNVRFKLSIKRNLNKKDSSKLKKKVFKDSHNASLNRRMVHKYLKKRK